LTHLVQRPAIADHQRGLGARLARGLRVGRVLRDHDAARFFGHVRARLRRVSGGLLRDDRVVAQLLELVD
jgi:hypothetical protein